MLGCLFAVCHLSNDLNISLPFIQLLLIVGNPDVVAFRKINSNAYTCFCGLFNSSFSCWQGWPGQQGVIAWKGLVLVLSCIYLLLTKFEGRTDRVVSSSIYGPSAKRAGHKSKGKKRGSVTYSTNRENEVSKIFIVSLVCLRGSGTILIHVERLQISDAPRKQNESIWRRC